MSKWVRLFLGYVLIVVALVAFCWFWFGVWVAFRGEVWNGLGHMLVAFLVNSYALRQGNRIFTDLMSEGGFR